MCISSLVACKKQTVQIKDPLTDGVWISESDSSNKMEFTSDKIVFLINNSVHSYNINNGIITVEGNLFPMNITVTEQILTLQTIQSGVTNTPTRWFKKK